MAEHRSDRGVRPDEGQAQIEVLAAVPVFVTVAVIILQLLGLGYAQSLADGAAEAGAVAVADGREPAPAVAAALPDWARGRIEVSVDGGRVRVELQPPHLLPAAEETFSVRSQAVAWGGG